MSVEEVTIKLAGQTRILKFDHNALADAEDLLGFSFLSLDLDQIVSFRNIRGMLWASLRQSWPGLKVEMAGKLIERADEGETPAEKFAYVTRQVTLAFRKQFASKDDEEEKKDGENVPEVIEAKNP